MNASSIPIHLSAGVRTPFLKAGGGVSHPVATGLSVPVAQAMMEKIPGMRPDLFVWGTVIPNLTWSSIGREVLLDAKLDATIPAYSTVMACSTSMMGAFQAAGMLDGKARQLAVVGGAESMSRVQIGLSQNLSDWMREFQGDRSLCAKLQQLAELNPKDV